MNKQIEEQRECNCAIAYDDNHMPVTVYCSDKCRQEEDELIMREYQEDQITHLEELKRELV